MPLLHIHLVKSRRAEDVAELQQVTGFDSK